MRQACSHWMHCLIAVTALLRTMRHCEEARRSNLSINVILSSVEGSVMVPNVDASTSLSMTWVKIASFLAMTLGAKIASFLAMTAKSIIYLLRYLINMHIPHNSISPSIHPIRRPSCIPFLRARQHRNNQCRFLLRQTLP